MSTINSNLSIPKLIKIEVDQFRNCSIEREKTVKMEMEMEMVVNLVREREWLKKEFYLLAETQSFTELEKCSLEEKLGRSERRCEELDERIVQLGEENKKLRQKKMNSEKAARFYKIRVDDLERRVLKLEAALAKVLNVNLANLDKFVAAAIDTKEEENLNMPDFAENGKVKANPRDVDRIGGIGLSKKGGRNMAYSGTKHAYISKAAESKGPLQDNDDQNREVRGGCYRISCRCTLKTIDVIKDNLQEENLEVFEKSCFGNLLKINKFKFQGQLLSQLLLQMDMSSSNEKRLIFKINNSNMEFGPSDFSRITGLRSGKLEEVTMSSSSSIHKDVFQGIPTITMKDFEEAFLNISSSHKGKGELTLKLALLYFLYGTLLTPSTKKIDVQYLYLVEDLQKFNAFPWGRVAYDFFVSSILQLRLRMGGLEVTDQVARFNIYGFCFALQAWAYEVMPSVASYCASRVNNFENVTPWILRWSATRVLRSDYLPLGDKSHLNNTMEKWEELSTENIPHVARQKKRKLLSDSDQMPHAQPSSAATPPPPSTNASTYSSHHLARRLSRAEGMLESIMRKVDQPLLDIGYAYDDLPRNEFLKVDDEADTSETTLTRHSISGLHPVSMNKATDKHARALSELANDNPETNAHLVESKMMHPSSAAVDVVIICDSEGDDYEVVVASASQSKDPDDDESLSDRYMNKLVAELKRKASGR